MIDSKAVTRTDQELIEGDTIKLYPITNGEFDRTASASEQLRIHPGTTGVQKVSVEDGEELVVKPPTQSTVDHWTSILSDDVSADNLDVDDGMLKVTLGEGEYRFECTPVGLRSAPDQGFVPREGQDDGDGLKDINPRDGTVFMNESDIDGDEAAITLENADDEDWTITEARIPFVLSTGDPTYADLDDDSSDRLQITEGFVPVTHRTIESGDDTTVTLHFDKNVRSPAENPNGPVFDPLVVFSIRIEQDDVVRHQTYFVTSSPD